MNIICVIKLSASNLYVVTKTTEVIKNLLSLIGLKTIITTNKYKKLYTILRSTNADKKSRQQFYYTSVKKNIHIIINKKNISCFYKFLDMIKTNLPTGLNLQICINCVYYDTGQKKFMTCAK
uniref:Ribosomal protein S10 n=1 Tax=Gloeochaete wittrockiana TaxID=38269 RepID=A0A096Y6S0_9EUKA|nr:ribosomal protein S10 [Gloeochaete wittrockiana]AIM52031.1 ribosomal protein S10 [Gloeochaete wittrockiana]